jgi:NAD dependent epimerase/dehydratase
MNWEGKPVLVTGAGGFIGSHLVERLVEKKAKVKAFIRYNSRNDRGMLEMLSPIIQEKIEVIAADLRDSEAVTKAARDVEVIFHLGSLIAIPYSYINPRDVFQTNIFGTLNVMQAARELKTPKVIHTSTSEVYGSAQYVPIDEKHPLNAQSPYSASKIGADKIAESYYRSYELPVTTVRPFNTYGPRQSARAIIPTIITQAIARKQILLGAMHPTRDLMFVTDTVEAFIKTAESSKTVGESINFGTGVELSMSELAEKIIHHIGEDQKIEIIFDATRIRPAKSEVDRLCADTSLAQKLVRWKPKVSIDDGLQKTIDWIAQNINLYKADLYNI